MTVKAVKNLKNLAGRTVFLRVDFNVPHPLARSGGRGGLGEDYRLLASLETIKFLLAHKCRLLLATHWGEPEGRRQEKLSLRPLARRLSALVKRPVKFVNAAVGPKVKAALKKLPSGGILLLENLRFYKGELANDPNFAKDLAALADIYVNDAFSVSHRHQASVAAIKNYLPAYAGLLLLKELAALNRILKPKKPLVVIIGGAKISTKAAVIKKLYPLANRILIGGALANNFFKALGFNIGRSLYEPKLAATVKKFISGRRLQPKIVLPLDVVVKTALGARLRQPDRVKKDESILDIGPATISLYAQYIKRARTLVWNGPMGKFEEPSFRQGTLSVARLVASRTSGPAYGVVGGGETVAALGLTKMAEYVDWVSTGGGALLTYLAGDEMPGLGKIIRQ